MGPRYHGGRWPLAILDVLLVSMIGFCSLIETRLHRIDAVARYPGKPTWGVGQDWLLVSRDRRPRTDARGPHGRAATDAAGAVTISLVHLANDGRRPVLVDLPVDTVSAVPGIGRGSFRLALARGGPRLLVKTIESAMNVGIERYAEIDLDGLPELVDRAGGLRFCADAARPGAGTPPGGRCPVLSGARVVARLRGFSSSGRADPRRMRLVTALVRRSADAAMSLDPVRSIPFAVTATGLVTVDDGVHSYDLLRLALALSRHGGPVTVAPRASPAGSLPGVGPVVAWDPDTANRLINAIALDRPLPPELIMN